MIAEESTAWPRRLAADLDGRPRVHLQVEHGLDARHARLLRERPGAPQVTITTSSRSRSSTRGRELRPAALARRGRARQGLAALARCRATAGSSSPTSARSTGHVGASRQEAPLHGRRARRSGASGRRRARSTGRCSTIPTTRACGPLSRDLNRAYRAHPSLWEVDFRPEGFAWLVGDAREENVIAFARFSASGEPLVCVVNFSPVVREDWRLPLPRRRALAGDRSTPTRASTRARTSATGSGSRRRRSPCTGSRRRASSRCRRWPHLAGARGNGSSRAAGHVGGAPASG